MLCKNKKGISLVESIVSILLLSIGVLAVLSMQPTSLKTGARSDYLGRATMLLNRELMIQEALIMNPCIKPVNIGTVNKTAQQGDVSYNVVIVTSAIAGSSRWKVTITVSWPPFNKVGITDNIIVTRQETFRSPDGCI
jgi:Tfp pilus assembly protein PilV